MTLFDLGIIFCFTATFGSLIGIGWTSERMLKFPLQENKYNKVLNNFYFWGVLVGNMIGVIILLTGAII